MEKTQHIQKLFAGLALYRQQVKQPMFDSGNPFFKSEYLSLKGVISTIDPALKGTGLAWTQFVYGGVDSPVVVQTMISHESGQYIMTPALAIQPAKNDAQGLGSAITYEKRYQLASLFGIVGDKDDDGNQATRPNYQRKPVQQPHDPQLDSEIAEWNKNAAELGKIRNADRQHVNDLVQATVGDQRFSSKLELMKAWNDAARALIMEAQKNN